MWSSTAVVLLLQGVVNPEMLLCCVFFVFFCSFFEFPLPSFMKQSGPSPLTSDTENCCSLDIFSFFRSFSGNPQLRLCGDFWLTSGKILPCVLYTMLRIQAAEQPIVLQ